MAGHLFDDLVRDRGDVGAGQRAFRDMHGMADAGGNDLRLDVVQGEHLRDIEYRRGAGSLLLRFRLFATVIRRLRRVVSVRGFDGGVGSGAGSPVYRFSTAPG